MPGYFGYWKMWWETQTDSEIARAIPLSLLGVLFGMRNHGSLELPWSYDDPELGR